MVRASITGIDSHCCEFAIEEKSLILPVNGPCGRGIIGIGIKSDNEYISGEVWHDDCPEVGNACIPYAIGTRGQVGADEVESHIIWEGKRGMDTVGTDGRRDWMG